MASSGGLRLSQRDRFLVLGSELDVGPPADHPPLTLPVEVAAVQQVAVRGPDVPVQRRILPLQPRESNRRLVEEQLQPRSSLAVVEDEEQVGGVRDDPTATETTTCGTRRERQRETFIIRDKPTSNCPLTENEASSYRAGSGSYWLWAESGPCRVPAETEGGGASQRDQLRWTPAQGTHPWT